MLILHTKDIIIFLCFVYLTHELFQSVSLEVSRVLLHLDVFYYHKIIIKKKKIIRILYIIIALEF